MPLFKPYEILNVYEDFDIDKYRSLGFDTLLVDIDNTLAIPDTELIASSRAKNFIDNLISNGFKVIVISNNKLKRVKPFADSLNVPFKHLCFKPLPFAYYSIIKEYNLTKNSIITLGDQIITDCIGANLVGLCPIYVKQLVQKDSYKTIINRFIERLIFRYILHEKM